MEEQSTTADAIASGVDTLNQLAALLPPRQRAKFKASLRKALQKCKGDQRAELKVLEDHLKKANEFLREVRL